MAGPELNRTIVSKSEFAALKKRAKSAVSNWIAEGKLTGASLVGSGVRAKIWLERAEAELAGTLAESQQVIQAAPANAATPADGDTLKLRREADTSRAQTEAELSKLKLAREEGRWIEAHRAQQDWGKQLAGLVAETESFIVNRLAREIAEAHGLDWKLLAITSRDKYRQFRRQVAVRAVETIEQQARTGTDT